MAGATLIWGYTFPDGQFVPRWTRWLALGWIAVSLVTNLPVSTPGAFYPWNWWSSPLFTLVQIAFYGSLALALLYRYRWVSTPVQRQQIKWVVFAATIVVGEAMTANLVLSVAPSYFPALALSAQLHQLVLLVSYLLPVLLPLSIGIALLRYRLWDIDIIINRTLVYGSLTALLALLYASLIFGLQALFQGMFHQNNAVAIAALFQPLRQRIQRVIDRRFYRRKYDAAKTLAAFSATLRNEVDLDELSRHLVAIVEETMQPAHVSLWLRPLEQDRRHQAT